MYTPWRGAWFWVFFLLGGIALNFGFFAHPLVLHVLTQLLCSVLRDSPRLPNKLAYFLLILTKELGLCDWWIKSFKTAKSRGRSVRSPFEREKVDLRVLFFSAKYCLNASAHLFPHPKLQYLCYFCVLFSVIKCCDKSTWRSKENNLLVVFNSFYLIESIYGLL